MQRVARSLVVLIATVSAAIPAFAETEGPVNLAEARTQFKAADRDLNEVWTRCTESERGSVAIIEQLRESQRKWIEVRDSTARAYQMLNSGKASGEDLEFLHAQTVMTWSRVEELKRLFGCEE